MARDEMFGPKFLIHSVRIYHKNSKSLYVGLYALTYCRSGAEEEYTERDQLLQEIWEIKEEGEDA
jgi:hypothetical protein